MYLKTILLTFILLIIIGCKHQEHKKEKITEIIQSEKIPDNLNDWLTAINSDNNDLVQNLYTTNAINVISADSIISGSTQIASYYTSLKNKIISITSLFSLEANKEKGITYEIVTYKTDDHKEYTQLVIWRMDDNTEMVRDFEFTEINNLESTKVDTTEIDERRKLWMELCNTHNTENLVNQLYSTNTIYFNHKPIVKGRENLIKEYAYMNSPNYSLQLHPTKLEVVNNNFVFEIGQCSGGYNGKYILIWKKEANGTWNIYIDSNI